MKFTAEYNDPTGLYHLRARLYDPTVGRFLSKDPVRSPNGARSLSLYPYVANRPTTLIDPSERTGQPTQPSGESRVRTLFPTSSSGVDAGARPSSRIIDRGVNVNPKNVGQTLYWYIELLNNAASREFLFRPISLAASDSAFDKFIVDPIVDQLLHDLFPNPVLTAASAFQNSIRAAHVEAAKQARHSKTIVRWVRGGRGLKVADTTVLEHSSGGISFKGIGVNVCIATLECKDQVINGLP
jgi:RHS repeat-associated protein